MSAEDNYNRLRDELDRQIRNDKRLRAITDKVKAGKATFQDTNRYSDIVSRMLGDILSKNVGEIKVPLGKEYACRELLRDQYERINEVLGDVQVSVDQKLGIHLNPIKAPFPEERVNAVAHSLEDPTVPEETIERRARSATENVSKSFHDDYTKANAEYRSKAGLKCYLVRDAGGRCCEWCAALEGRYDYASAPQDVFRKHDNCTCSVTYECGRMRQDVWSKRKWEATDEELAARKEASGAAKPIKRTREQAEELNRKLTEQSKPVVNTREQAKELEQKLLDKSEKGGIIELEEVDGLEQAKKRDRKIEITDIAIDKISQKYIPDLDDIQNQKINSAHRTLLTIAKNENNSNEVAYLIDLNSDETAKRLGGEHAVNIFENPIAVSMAEHSNFLFLAHNHPSTKDFSYSDLGVFLSNDSFKGISVVSNTGDVHILFKSNKYDFDKAYEAMSNIRAKYGDYNEEVDAAIVKDFLKICKTVGIVGY